MLGLMAVLPGCFFGIGTPLYGSKGCVIDTVAVYKLSHPEVMPTMIDRGGNVKVPEQGSIAVWLVDALKTMKSFSLVDGDSLAKSDGYRNANKISGARLYSKIVYVDRRFEGSSATMTLILKANMNDSIIVYSSHDTYRGNTYFFRPDIQAVTRDAIEGAVNKLESLIQDAR
jgi:hypothetical protein